MAGLNAFGSIPGFDNAIASIVNSGTAPASVLNDIQDYNNGVRNALSPASQAYIKRIINAQTNPYASTLDPFTGGSVNPLLQSYTYPTYQQTPSQLNAMAQMAQAYASMYGSDNNLAGVLGSSYNAGLSGVQQAMVNANASMNNAAKSLEASNYGADKQLAGVGLTTDAQKNIQTQVNNRMLDPSGDLATQRQIANTQANAQLGTAYMQNVAKYNALGNLLGTGSGGLSGSIGGGIGGGLGTISAIGGTGTGTDANGNPYGGPPVPTFTPLNSIVAQQMLGQQNAPIVQHYSTLAKHTIPQMLASHGFAVKDNPGAQAYIQGQAYQPMQAQLTQNVTNMNQNIPQYNAQNALGYGQAGLSQYNAAADRNLQAYLGNLSAQHGTLNTVLGA